MSVQTCKQKPSQWCFSKWESAVEADDKEAAEAYMQLYQLWDSRGM